MYRERIENLGQRLTKALSIRNMKPSELCDITKIPRSSMTTYMSGDYEPKQDRIYLIAQALNVSEAWLMGYDVPMSRNTPGKQELTESEGTMLELFRQVPEESRQMIVDMIRVASKKK